jgi:hypothetical protein
VVEEELKSSVYRIPTLWKEEKIMWRGEESIIRSSLKEGDVSVLKNQRWPPGVLGAGESREPTKRRRTEILSGGRNYGQDLTGKGVAVRNGFWRHFGRCFGRHDRAESAGC